MAILVDEVAEIGRDHGAPSNSPDRVEPPQSRMESPADWPVEGLLVHAPGQGPSGFRVVDVWESEEAARRFGERLAPILEEIGIQEQPEVYPTHTFVSA